MKDKVTLHEALSDMEPPSSLYAATLARIAFMRRRAAMVRTLLLGGFAFLSGAIFVPSLAYAVQEFHASGFYDYATLLISDRGLVLTFWREFVLSLLDSLPSFAVLLLLATSVAFIWSLRRMVPNARVAFMQLPSNA